MALMVKDKIIYGSIKEVPSFGFTPVGTVIAVMGNTAPNHYLICNGQEVSIKSYPELALYFNEQFGSINHFGGNGTTTFCVPDLRGEFLRGTGTNSHANQGNGADVGVHQDSTTVPIFRQYGYENVQQLRLPYKTSFTPVANTDGIAISGSDRAVTYDGRRDGSWSTSNESITGNVRPTNTSVLYCIAVHDIYVDARYNYSLEEQVVGRWIDGKPIYQKTITDLNLRLSWDGQYRAQAQLTNPIQNLDNLIDCKGVGVVSAISKPHYYDLSAYVESNGKINVMGLSGDVVKTITLQYTKTTD